MLIISLNTFGQTIYQWTNGVPPLEWVSTPSVTNNTFGWHPLAGLVSTSEYIPSSDSWHTYNNSQNTMYTWEANSHILNQQYLCPQSSMFVVTYTVSYHLENNFDFLYFQYNLNNSATWTTLATYTGGYNIITQSFTFPFQSGHKFRFYFRSDGSVNTYNWGSNIYYADVLSFKVDCLIVLGEEDIKFEGYKEQDYVNKLYWSSETENSFELHHSVDGLNWNIIHLHNGDGGFFHKTSYPNNYYKLVADSGFEKILYIKNEENTPKVFVKYYNILGQEVSSDTKGILIAIDVEGNKYKIYK